MQVGMEVMESAGDRFPPDSSSSSAEPLQGPDDQDGSETSHFLQVSQVFQGEGTYLLSRDALIASLSPCFFPLPPDFLRPLLVTVSSGFCQGNLRIMRIQILKDGYAASPKVWESSLLLPCWGHLVGLV